MDVYDRKKRGEVMAKVRSRDTKPELAVRRALHRMGLRFRLYAGHLPGRPDLVFPRHRVALFVHGCFWHGHRGCKRSKVPATQGDFWATKIGANIERDARNIAAIESLGWRALVVWECEITEKRLVDLCDEIVGVDRLGRNNATRERV